MPPPYTDTARHVMLNELGTVAVYASLHSADPGVSGSNEISGGSPAYARQAITWAGATGGAMVASINPTFDVAAGTTVKFAGFWSAVTAGSFYGSGPLGGGALVGFLSDSDNVTDDYLQAPGHGFVDGSQVVVSQLAGRSTPTGISAGSTYYVVNSSADGLQVSTTLAGVAINITAIGEGYLQKIVPEVFAGQGTYTLTNAQLNLLAA